MSGASSSQRHHPPGGILLRNSEPLQESVGLFLMCRSLLNRSHGGKIGFATNGPLSR